MTFRNRAGLLAVGAALAVGLWSFLGAGGSSADSCPPIDPNAGGVVFPAPASCAPIVKRKHVSAFTHVNVGDGLDVSDPQVVGYQLTDWDPKGGPIVISWGGKKVESISPEQNGSVANFSFESRFKLTSWPVRPKRTSKQPCSGTLTATQGDVTRTIKLEGKAVGGVLEAKHNKNGLKTGDTYCTGELGSSLLDPAGGMIVYSIPAPSDFGPGVGTLPSPSSSYNVTSWAVVDSDELDIHVNAVALWSGRWLCVALANSGWVKISVASRDTFDVGQLSTPCAVRPRPGPLPGLQAFDPSRLGVKYVNWSPPLAQDSLSSYYRSADSLDLPGPLSIDEGFLYVDGDVTLKGGLNGTGALISTGRIMISGPTTFKARAHIALYAAGDIILAGNR
jgi:hypothetical protein